MGVRNISITSTLLFFLVLAHYVHSAPGVVFDVTKYGAKPNADISQAIMSAWKGACASVTPSSVVIPKGTFLSNQLKIEGPCKSPVEFQLQGTLQAPADPSKMNGVGEWITFRNIDHFTLFGGGVFDGQGKIAWAQNDCKQTGKCSKLPNNLSFNFLTNSVLRDVTTLDSKLFHVNVLGCKNLTFQRFTVTAPGESLNTDGIHIGRSSEVTIIDSVIKTGDDCVSIGDGSRQVRIEKVTCGPGHGISIGSLGKYPKEDDVVGIYVKNCTLINTGNGVRVKTWPASEPGVATDLHFEDIIMENVGTPVLIDQVYCPHNKCTAQVPSNVKLSKISFKNIRGTSSTQVAVKLACSKKFPCQGVEVANIDLKYTGKEGPAKSECSDVKPMFTGSMNPPACA